MTTTEYTDFNKATEALQAAMAEGKGEAALKTYQRPEDRKWVWAVAAMVT